MSVKIVECLFWSAPNQPGKLLSYAAEFETRKVNLDGLWAYTSNGGGKIAAIGKNTAQLKAALRSMGVKAHTSRCFYITGKDRAGALVNALHKLSMSGINVECADALAAQGKFAATLWVKDRDFSKAKKLLR